MYNTLFDALEGEGKKIARCPAVSPAARCSGDLGKHTECVKTHLRTSKRGFLTPPSANRPYMSQVLQDAFLYAVQASTQNPAARRHGVGVDARIRQLLHEHGDQRRVAAARGIRERCPPLAAAVHVRTRLDQHLHLRRWKVATWANVGWGNTVMSGQEFVTEPSNYRSASRRYPHWTLHHKNVHGARSTPKTRLPGNNQTAESMGLSCILL